MKLERCLAVSDAEAARAEQARAEYQRALSGAPRRARPPAHADARSASRPPTGIGDLRAAGAADREHATRSTRSAGPPSRCLRPAEDGLPASVQLVGKTGRRRARSGGREPAGIPHSRDGRTGDAADNHIERCCVPPYLPPSVSACSHSLPPRRRRSLCGCRAEESARLPAARRRAGRQRPSPARRPSPGIPFPARSATSFSSRRARPSARAGSSTRRAALTSPVAAPTVMLPWITGNPHALFARVRGITASATTPWSTPFGFDMVPGSRRNRCRASRGCCAGRRSKARTATRSGSSTSTTRRPRWKPSSPTSWTSASSTPFTARPAGPAVRWRIRALRTDRTDNNMQTRQNGLPAVGYGPWSPVYNSTNPPYVGGPIKLGHTVSDVVSAGDAGSPAHRLMPAFTFSGDQAERRHECGALPRLCLHGPAMPQPCLCKRRDRQPRLRAAPVRTTLAARLAGSTARGTCRYLSDGSEPDSYTFDGLKVQSTELKSAATPTTAVPADSDSGSTVSRRRSAAGPDRQRRPRRPGRPLGHGLAGQRLLLDRHSRRGRFAGSVEDQYGSQRPRSAAPV